MSRRFLCLLVVFLLLLRGMTGAAMVAQPLQAGVAPAQPASLVLPWETASQAHAGPIEEPGGAVTLADAASLHPDHDRGATHAPSIASIGAGPADGAAPSHHGAAPAGVPCHGDSDAGDSPHTANCKVCDICHASMLLATWSGPAVLPAPGTPGVLPPQAFASAARALSIRPPIA